MIVPGDWTCVECKEGDCKPCMAANGYLYYADPDDQAGNLVRCNCHIVGHNEEARAWHARPTDEARRVRRRPRVSESVRVRKALAKERKVQKARGIQLTHGIVDTYDDYGCRCQRCRIAKAKDSGRPRDPHWPAHLVDR